MKSWIQMLRLPLVIIGVALFFYGERYLGGQALHWWFSGAGLFLVASGLVISLLSKQKSQYAGEKDAWCITLGWQAMLLAGLIAFLGYRQVLGTAAEPETNVARLLLALWLTLVVLSVLWGIGVEWAFHTNGRGPLAESKRVSRSGRAWLLVGLLLGTIVALNYVAVRKDRSWDWSYLKTTQPSPSTEAMLAGLENEIQIGLFFSATNEVAGHVRNYFERLPQKSGKVKVEYYDTELNPGAAEAFKATKNGQVVLKYGTTTERMDIGTKLTDARRTLKTLDAEFQKSLLAATEKRKVLYFTTGHGELSWTGSNDDPMHDIKLLEGFLRGQNFTMNSFGVGEGSAKKVPDDADAVVIVGGNAPMLKEEVMALEEYLNRGGSIFALLDLDRPADTVVSKQSRDVDTDPLIQFLAKYGVRYHPVPLANQENYVSATRSEADAWFLFTNSFTSHDSVTSLARNDQRAAVLTFRSGYLELAGQPKDWQTFEAIRSLPDTFADENRDFKFNDGKEKKMAYIQGTATIRNESPGVTKRGKLFTFADASVVSDVLVRNQGNLIFFVEGLRWLVGDSKANAGIATSEEDVRIRHTRKEDLAWFYGTVLLVPGLVLGIGALATRRARRSR